MNRLKMLSYLLLLLFVAIFMISCGGSSEELTAVLPEPTAELDPSPDFVAPTTKSEVPRITAEELKERLDAGEEIVIADTRSESAFGFEHIAGAISVPETAVESHLDELLRDREIVFYCT